MKRNKDIASDVELDTINTKCLHSQKPEKNMLLQIKNPTNRREMEEKRNFVSHALNYTSAKCVHKLKREKRNVAQESVS